VVRKKRFTIAEARQIGEALGVDWTQFDVKQYRMGLDVELEHGARDPVTNVTNDDPEGDAEPTPTLRCLFLIGARVNSFEQTPYLGRVTFRLDGEGRCGR